MKLGLNTILGLVAPCAWLAVSPAWSQTPVGPGFTYQGRVEQNGVPVNGSVSLGFTLWDERGTGTPPTGGTIIGAQAFPSVPVSDGLFTIVLNDEGQFGANAFDGSERWLQVAVNTQTLSPRQPITSAPYASRAAAAATAAHADVATIAESVVDDNSLNSSGNGPEDALFVDAFGRVGIGTTSPISKVHISGQGATRLAVLSSGGPAALDLNSLDQPGVVSILRPETSPELRFRTSSTDRMTIAPFGQVGIGTTDPTNLLNLYGSVGGSDPIEHQHNLQLQINSGFGEDSLAIGVLDNGRAVIQAKEFSVGYNWLMLNPAGGPVILAGDQVAGSNVGVRYAYGNVDLTVRNLSTNQKVFVCETTDGNNLFEVRANGDVISECGVLCSSDLRKKTNVQPLDCALDKVLKLRGVTFDWTDTSLTRGTQIGFIAQEVQQVLPELVDANEEGFLAVRYVNAVPLLVEAIKTQARQIDELGNANAALERRLAALESFMAASSLAASSDVD